MFEVNTKCASLGAPIALSQIQPWLFPRLTHFYPASGVGHMSVFTCGWQKKCCFREHFRRSQLLTDESTAGGEGRRDTAPHENKLSHLLVYGYRKPPINTHISAVGDKVSCCLSLKCMEEFVVPHKSFACFLSYSETLHIWLQRMSVWINIICRGGYISSKVLNWTRILTKATQKLETENSWRCLCMCRIV